MGWTYLWTSAHVNFTEEQKYENANLLWHGLAQYGWSDEAIAGCMGNFEYESGGQFNLGQWQYGSTVGDWYNDTVGLGLGQWTPASKLAEFCNGYTEAACCNGDKQVQFTAEGDQWLNSLVSSNGVSRYYGASGIPYFSTFSEYTADTTHTPEDMALSWFVSWERGSKKAFNTSMDDRKRYARKWYNQFAGDQAGYPINIKVNGNGRAWASYNEVEVHRGEAGQRIELGAVANTGNYFQLWSVSYPSSLQLEQPITIADNYFTMPNSRVDLTAQFTGETPTPPPEPPPPYKLPKLHRMPIWMYPSLRT